MQNGWKMQSNRDQIQCVLCHAKTDFLERDLGLVTADSHLRPSTLCTVGGVTSLPNVLQGVVGA
jgi:hypothetical protein